jgi:hypothetical protein
MCSKETAAREDEYGSGKDMETLWGWIRIIYGRDKRKGTGHLWIRNVLISLNLGYDS